jgi:hypothetical protein
VAVGTYGVFNYDFFSQEREVKIGEEERMRTKTKNVNWYSKKMVKVYFPTLLFACSVAKTFNFRIKFCTKMFDIDFYTTSKYFPGCTFVHYMLACFYIPL